MPLSIHPSVHPPVCYSFLPLSPTGCRDIVIPPRECNQQLSGWRGGQLVPDLAESISLKSLHRFALFQVLCNCICIGLYLCTAIIMCPFVTHGLAHGPKTCQICYQWGPHFAECRDCITLKPLDILSPLKSSIELSRPVVVLCYDHLPIDPYGLAHGPEHISEITGQIFSIQSSVELSRLVVMQHHGHLPI